MKALLGRWVFIQAICIGASQIAPRDSPAIDAPEQEVYLYTVKVLINTFSKARRFCSAVNRLEGEFDLVSDRYVINAKSMLGIFSLDLSQPLQLNIYSQEPREQVLEALASFIVPETEEE